MKQVNAFIGCMLHVIFIGGVCIRGDYLNTMFVAVAVIGNNNAITIEFSIDVEVNIESCTWFLMRLNDDIREGREVTFVSNKDDVISSLIGHIFPASYHGYSCKSVFTYLHFRIGQNTHLEYLFFSVCKSYTMYAFQYTFSR